ncbi:hypothetical protein BCR44DRAFT_360187 [Catenaria anguillulae PL171]|uniref:Ubiquitin 3 binding protein But2 C-terminal domain-containing protein n=1 Tax=Catenaria anguillulae PL171 TaxID=765915 RepID=A0A1Y2I0X8_9FUNG|nr:hypothetical protein BCR44DRAFT_360187 [Catenaria anguillulae PL171]
MVKLLALLALAAAASSTVDATAVPPTSKPFLKFDKTTLNIQGNVAGEKLSVSLNEKPTDDVVVYLEAPNTRFDKCSLAFTPDNFDKPQELTVVSLPFADAAPGARNIPIKFTAFTEDCADKHHNVSIELPTTRTPEGSGQCQVTGDPHFKAFDQSNLFHYMGYDMLLFLTDPTLPVSHHD